MSVCRFGYRHRGKRRCSKTRTDHSRDTRTWAYRRNRSVGRRRMEEAEGNHSRRHNSNLPGRWDSRNRIAGRASFLGDKPRPRRPRRNSTPRQARLGTQGPRRAVPQRSSNRRTGQRMFRYPWTFRSWSSQWNCSTSTILPRPTTWPK